MIVARDYQSEALAKICRAMDEHYRALMVMATGLGKTITSALWVQEQARYFGRGLFLCHDVEILRQAQAEFQKVFNGSLSMGEFHGRAKSKTRKGVDVVFATWQTMQKHLRKFHKEDLCWIIVDEAHHSEAETWREVLQYFHPLMLLGMTATPDREDDADIRNVFGEPVVDLSLEWAIANGKLVPLEYHVVTDTFDQEEFQKLVAEVETGRRISMDEINSRVFVAARDEKVAEEISQYPGQRIIFCPNVEYAEQFVGFLPADSAAAYHSRLPVKKQAAIMDAFRQGRLESILVIDKFNEGVDVPDVANIVFLRRTESERIFRQQLGRGLRLSPGKKKLVVLDFVANAQRLMDLHQMAEEVESRASSPRDDYDTAKVNISGTGFNFSFAIEQVDLIRLLKRIRVPFYETWQEAGAAAQKLGIKASRDYRRKYRKDPKLPSAPNKFYYPDFPDWDDFLGRTKYYKTWQKAGAAAQKLGIKTGAEYKREYKKDPKLPSNPFVYYYPDFPDWYTFTGRETHYKTWQKAGAATVKLGIKAQREYHSRYKEDPRLPSNPDKSYSDFPGWLTFLGRKKPVKKYPTWQKAGAAAVKLGIKTVTEYQKRYKEDPRLPASPYQFYSDFPGFSAFLGRKKK